jgi:hypothetical protein
VEKLTVGNLLAIQRKKIIELGTLNQNCPESSNFGYISYKAAAYLVMPTNIYKRNEYFNYPLDEWDNEKLKLGCEKIIYNCSGINKNNVFSELSINEIKNLFELFHFSFINIETICNEENIYELKFIHKTDERTYTTFCMNNNFQHEIQYLNVPTKNKYTKISVDNESKLIKILTDNQDLGIESEYSYIKMVYKNVKFNKQTLSKILINNENKWVDIINFESNNKKYEQIFDISEFYK